MKPIRNGERRKRDAGTRRSGQSIRGTSTATWEQFQRPDGTADGVKPRRLRIAGDAASLRGARHLVDEALIGYPFELREAAVLLAAEIATNAVVHGGGWFLLQVDLTPDRLRVEVTDSSPGQPRVLEMNSDREYGRGMAIVDAIATKWGSDRLGTRKVVWFELCADP